MLHREEDDSSEYQSEEQGTESEEDGPATGYTRDDQTAAGDTSA